MAIFCTIDTEAAQQRRAKWKPQQILQILSLFF